MLKKSAACIADGYRVQANESFAAGDASSARLRWRQAIRIFRVALGTGASPGDDALAHAAIAECECRLGRPEAALAESLRGLEQAALSRSPLVLARCHLWESHALHALGRLDAARRACESARDAAEQLDHHPILAECLEAEARLDDLAGRFESAQDLEVRARQVSQERSAFFARVRAEIARLWESGAAPPSMRNVA